MKMGKQESEKEKDNVDWWRHRIDSRGIVEMGEWHGYGERTGKKQEGGKKKKQRENGQWRWQRSGREKCDLLGSFEMNGRDEIKK